MILKACPALKAPMLTTAEFWGSTLRDTMLYKATTSKEAA